MKARWNGTVVAESDDTVIVEGNHYFPRDSLHSEYFQPSSHSSHCPWKGDASYLTISVNGEDNINAAWYYETPKTAAGEIAGRVAFWRGVLIEE